jgi:DNA-binding GntR family transcriptional regulator
MMLLETQLLSQKCHFAIRTAIIEGEFQVGDRLPEGMLAAELQVSRSPIREALRELSRDGFVTIIPRRGAFVAECSEEEIIENFDIRERLEGLAVRFACQKASDEELANAECCLEALKQKSAKGKSARYSQIRDFDFHIYIVKISKNKTLKMAMKPIWHKVKLLRLKSFSKPERIVPALEEHFKILEAMKARDIDLAERRMIGHIRNSKQNTLKIYRKERSLNHSIC